MRAAKRLDKNKTSQSNTETLTFRLPFHVASYFIYIYFASWGYDRPLTDLCVSARQAGSKRKIYSLHLGQANIQEQKKKGVSRVPLGESLQCERSSLGVRG